VTRVTYGCDCKPFAFMAVNKVVIALTANCDAGHSTSFGLGFKL
jgi:hypothetical protein